MGNTTLVKVYRHPQKKEMVSPLIRLDPYYFRLAYERSNDSVESSSPGQDYLLFSQTDNILLFAVCDGVSQSFMGDIGAKILGNALIQFLSQIDIYNESPKIEADFNQYLHTITKDATEQISSYVLPDNLPKMLKDVLEEKRLLGSQSTFVCGRIDLPSQTNPKGNLILFWMGDTRLRFWNMAGFELLDFKDKFITAQRWSTLSGPIGGASNFYKAPLSSDNLEHSLGRLIIFTDGLPNKFISNHVFSKKEILDIIQQTRTYPENDDIAVFEFWHKKFPITA